MEVSEVNDPHRDTTRSECVLRLRLSSWLHGLDAEQRHYLRVGQHVEQTVDLPRTARTRRGEATAGSPCTVHGNLQVTQRNGGPILPKSCAWRARGARRRFDGDRDVARAPARDRRRAAQQDRDDLADAGPRPAVDHGAPGPADQPYTRSAALSRMAPPSELACSRSNVATTGLSNRSGNRTLCAIVGSVTQEPPSRQKRLSPTAF